MQQISEEYYDIPASANNAAAVTPIGDLYRYGGWTVVVLGMAILGAWIRFLDQLIDARRNPHAGMLLLVIVWSTVVGEAGWVQIFSSIPVLAAFWVVVVALVFRRRSVS
jgi:hypothetical protein